MNQPLESVEVKMSPTEMIDARVYTSALECAVPIYIKMLPGDIAALFDWVETGKTPHNLLANHSEAWLITAYSELREAGMMADKWLQVHIRELYEQQLDGLNDLSLVAYVSVVQDRSHEATDNADDRSRMYDAYRRLIQNPRGSILLDYGWLYGDVLDYQVMPEDELHWQIQDCALAHAICYGDEGRIFAAMVRRISDEIEMGDLNRGVEWISRIFENFAGRFCVYESAAAAFFQGNHNLLGQMVLQAASSLNLDAEDAHAYQDLCFMYRRKETGARPSPDLEKRLAMAMANPAEGSKKLTLLQLIQELFPSIDRVPVKQIASP
jgi:hypothetical protein